MCNTIMTSDIIIHVVILLYFEGCTNLVIKFSIMRFSFLLFYFNLQIYTFFSTQKSFYIRFLFKYAQISGFAMINQLLIGVKNQSSLPF